MRLTVCLVMSLFILAGCAIKPETGVVSGVDILEYGFEVQDKNDSDSEVVLENSSNIPYKQATDYGLRFRLNGEPDGSAANLKLLWITTPDSRTTKQARSRVLTRELSMKIGGTYYMTSSTIWYGEMRRPYRTKFVIGDNDGTIYAEMSFWIVDDDD